MNHLRRLFFDDLTTVQKGAQACLSDEDAHYVSRVLRIPEGGAAVAVCRSSSEAYSGTITYQSGQTFFLIGDKLEDGSPNDCHVITLAFAMLKGKRNELIIEKATELGVQRIYCFQADRSVMRLKGDKDNKKKAERYQKVAEQAVSQSRQNSIPEVILAPSLDSVLTGILEGTAPEKNSIKDNLLALALTPNAIPLNNLRLRNTFSHLLVGPEGDFSPREYAVLEEHEVTGALLPCAVLRAETAAIAGVAMVHCLSLPE